jgi:protoporphyrinogen oxidase
MKGLADVPSVALPLLRRYRSYNIKFPGWWKHGDLETAESFLSGRTSRDFRRALAEPVALFALGAELNKISAAGLMVAIRCVFADRSLGFTTGMGSLAAALAQKVEVLAGMEATEILTKGRTARGVRARPTNGGMARSYGADVVVCAVPAPQAAALCMDLSTEARSLLNETEYGTEVVVNLAFEGEARGVVGPVLLPRAEGFSAGWVCTNASKAYEYAPEGSSVVTVVFSGAQAPALLQKDDGTLVELALVEARRVYDLGGASAVLTRVDRHELARPVVSPGHADRVRWLMDKGSGFANLLLAGDWTSSPTVEGAVASGFRAAELAPAPIRGERMTEVNP